MKLKSKSGLTLVEMLCCVVVMLLVSIGMVNGVTLAVNSYQKSLMASESEILCSTLTSLVSDELRFSGTVEATEPVTFFSRTYGKKCSFGQDDNGQVTLGGNKLLPSKAYHLGMKASVTVTKKENSANVFSVTILVSDSQNRELAKNEFEVEKLNSGASAK